ncbi:NAD(P)-binding protein [Polychaeton citri CBS 116435]|uniref:NAD(P)-binding protein n=1 Tax=Polychaeton citri CBS 116435 TaxID=1314669 RepID=A0A9P4Q7U9_9PEZI|nr:NAD(P)-binding protein [Polychaeton citri CBS 116435]
MGDQNGSGGKPSVLIVGGLGYIGRFLANHIHTNNLASTLRLVDKQLPQLASLAPEFETACSEGNFMQADASREQSQARIFDLPDGKQFDYVFNCGGETRFSQEDEVYKLRSYELSLAVGREAAKRHVRAFVEVSTGSVYNSNKTPQRETDKTSKPHTKQAKWKLAAEEELAKIEGLKLVILRPAQVYGPYTGKWLSTQLALARLYQERSKEKPEKLKYLWDSDLRTNTVHVEDVARACWMAAEWRTRNESIPNAPSTSPNIFNVVDRGSTSQGTMAEIIRQVFSIEVGFQNFAVNTFARLNLEYVVDDVNDDTLDDWADLQEQAGIRDNGGPLSPFMEKELLRDMDLSLDGSRFESVVGWRPEHERISRAEVEAVIESYRRMKWWP